jgi:LacI family transcriptional regulator
MQLNKNSNRSVTIKTISKEFNVTPATVTKALRGNLYYSEAKKNKIRELAEELSYKSNLVARNLISKPSNFIGIFVPDISFPFLNVIVRRINITAKEYSLRQ